MSEKQDRATVQQGDRKAGPGLERRGFLRGIGVAAGGAAAAAPVVLGGAVEAAESPEEQVEGRYRESDHVKNYYHLNRL